MLVSTQAYAETGLATYYTVKSCHLEGNSGITASGVPLDDKKATCALRTRKYGQFYRVVNLDNGKSVDVVHNDYGPGRGPARRGVVVDLSLGAWRKLGLRPLNEKGGRGEVRVSVERVYGHTD